MSVELISIPNTINANAPYTIVFQVVAGFFSLVSFDYVDMWSDEQKGEETECVPIVSESLTLICLSESKYCYANRKVDHSNVWPFSSYERTITLNIGAEILNCSGIINVKVRHDEFLGKQDSITLKYKKSGNVFERIKGG